MSFRDPEIGSNQQPPDKSYVNEAFEGNKSSDNAENIVNIGDAGLQQDSAEDDAVNNSIIKCIVTPLQFIKRIISRYLNVIKMVFVCVGVLAYIAAMIAALVINFHRAIPLLVLFCLVLLFQIYAFCRDKWGKKFFKVFNPTYKEIDRNIYWIKWVVLAIFIVLLVIWIALDTSKRPNQLISMAGYIVLIFALFIGSKYPGKVKWRPVFWGFGMQLFLAMFILRTQPGFDAFNWLGYIVETFLNFVNAGCIFVFGELYYQHFFAFKVLPIIIYMSSFISILYYLGAMQWLIYKLSWVVQFSLGTSATESMCATGNIFVGMTESPLLIRPYMQDLTMSELHAVMTAGFGTIAGSVLGAYLEMGIQPYYVIPASVMAAPCALAVSKLVYPETKTSKFMTTAGLKLEKVNQRNVVEAAFAGASAAIPLVLNIAATMLAFTIILAAINAGLSWFGGMFDFPQLSFELICSYVFMPITYLMGIEWQDCFKCAELLGTKIFLNEFIAYKELGKLIDNREDGSIARNHEGTVNWISERSEAIITYALCGFANFASVGIMIGGLSALCPQRQGDIAKIVIRSMIAGVCVSLLNACVAGFLYVPQPSDCNLLFSAESWPLVEQSSLRGCCEVEMKNSSSTDACRCCEYSSWPDENYANFTCTGNSICNITI